MIKRGKQVTTERGKCFSFLASTQIPENKLLIWQQSAKHNRTSNFSRQARAPMKSKVGLVYSYSTEAAFRALCVKEHLDSEKLSFHLSQQTARVPTPYHCLAAGVIYRGGRRPSASFPSCTPQY
ncbi:UNVERIFIED_CONTAM: hypothetical protein K2H54_018877 [Gekko kuhli]